MPAINMCAGIYVDKTALISAINTANTKNQNDYTPNSWTPFAASRAAAITVRDNAFALQAEIDAATYDLKAKTNALVARANRTALGLVIDRAETYSADDYTPESVAPFYQSYLNALSVYDNLNATQAQVDAAANDLLRKINGLVRKTTYQTTSWATLYQSTYVVIKSYWSIGGTTQAVHKLGSAAVWSYAYVGLGQGGVDVSKEGHKTVVGVTFPKNIKKCTIKCLRVSDYPSTGGAPLAQVGTGNVVLSNDVGNRSFEQTYCTGNTAQFATGAMGWFDVDYTVQAKNLQGQTVNLIFEPVDSSDGGMAGGYKINEMKIEFEIQ